MNSLSRLLPIVAALLLSPVAQAGNAADDFSATTNPNGPWSYGWTTSLSSSFTLFVNRVASAGSGTWYGNSPAFGGGVGYPAIWGSENPSNGILGSHPGPNGEYAVLRWIAPTSASTAIAAQFSRLDSASTNVNILVNGASIFAGFLSASSLTQSFAQTLSLTVGDTVDFAVGYGVNGNYFNDSTGINANISAVPEPASIALFLAGALLVSHASRSLKMERREEA